MRYNYQSEYLELCFQYMALVYDFLFFACRVPVFLWNKFSHTIYEWGWCADNPAYTEFLVVLLFISVWLVLQKVIFLPFRLYDTFVIEEQAGFNNTTGGTWFKIWIKGILLVIILYWALIMLALTLIEVSGNYLVLTFAVATLVISILLVIIFPLVIAPLFNTYEELGEEEYDGFRADIFENCKNIGHPLKKIYIQKDSLYTEHSNASVMGQNVYLSDNLFKHHENREQILAVVAHECCHAKHHHLFKSALVDVIYMMIYALGLSYMVKYGNPVVASFGFTYQSSFVSLYLFQSIFVEIPDFFLRLFINWYSRNQEYEADAFAGSNGFNRRLREALIIMFIKNEDHLAPDATYTMVKKTHPNINQRIKALDDQYNNKNLKDKSNINASGLQEPLLQEKKETTSSAVDQA